MPSRVNQFTRFNKQKIVYRDFRINLDRQPVTGELDVNVNEKAVMQSITNLVLTYPGERYYHPEIGSTVSRSLFEFVDDFTTDRLKESILQTIQFFEPRAQNVEVTVKGDPANHLYNVEISFQVLNISPSRFIVPTIVLRVR